MLNLQPNRWGISVPQIRRQPDKVCFGAYEIHLPTQEVFKYGSRIKLPPQAFRVLQTLLDRPGQLVTREEFHRALWPADTFVDFEHGLNNAIKKIRDILSDSADAPRYIETLPKLGYRFIGQMDGVSHAPSIEPKPAGERNHAFVVVVLLIVVCVGAIVWAARFRRSHGSERVGSEVLPPVPFTAFAGEEIAPTFSPDGSQIAFGWNGDAPAGSRSKGFDLYVKVIGSENLLRLTHQPSESIHPAWSPDGQRIAFHRISGPDTGIYIVPALGGPERKLLTTHATVWASGISWSRDSKWIVYSDAVPLGTHHRLYVLSVETLQQLPIRHMPECVEELDPAFSPLSTIIAYVCHLETDDFALYSVEPPAGVPQKIGTYEGWGWGTAWRGGNRLVLSRYLYGTNYFELYEVTLPNGSIRKLRSEISGDAEAPITSITGNKLAYQLNQHRNANIWRKDLLHPQTTAIEIIASSRVSEQPQYSPDGKYIAFQSDRGGNFEIWLSRADGSNLVRLSDLKNAQTGTPNWSPDGSKIAFDSRRGGLADVYIESVSELVPRKLVTNVANISTPSWSHDGKWIYFVAGGIQGRIYRCPAEGGPAARLSSGVGWGPQESFDGREVFFTREFAGYAVLIRISLDVGTESVVEGLHISSEFVPNWALTRNGIYFQPAEADDVLQFFDFASKKKSQVLTIARGTLWGLSVSPDGRWISYSQFGGAASDIMLVENFTW
ncbi:MAG TPA: winged helix-turn-helix domain-containing protein [Candidatus Sulfotelmatobacter sp.]|nr:winged helix-turn-helix domain-containing protein [Candidatus Sulfotelmatobacter sp.]